MIVKCGVLATMVALNKLDWANPVEGKGKDDRS